MQIEFHLGDPGFTLLHRAGLAGLWMTLKQLDKEIPPENRPGGLKWQSDTDGLLTSHRRFSLIWEGNDQEVLDWLLKQSFQIRDGLIFLRGLDSKTMRKDSQVIVHQGILGTFLQHNSTHKSTGTQTISLQLEDDKPEVVITYKALQSYAYQDFALYLCDKQGKLLKKSISIAGWLNPGAVVRHVAFSDTSFEEPPEQALVLLFAPVACYYYILRSKLRDKRAQYALVIPEVTELEKYAQYRQNPHLRNASYKDFHTSGLGDAGLRFLTYETTTEIASKLEVPRCKVLTLGTVAWATQQKTRTDVYVVEPNAQVCKNYQICSEWLSDRVLVGREGGFVASSFARELIAENIARAKPWYFGISDKVNSNELFKQLTYERRGLYQMVQNAEWDDERERLFVQACHQALSFTYGQVASNTKPGERPNFDKVTVRLRTGLGRCKNAETFREFIIDFWSRAGRIPTLQEHWQDLMELLTDNRNWKKARDLALLALASYKGKGVTDSDDDTDASDEDDELIDIGL